jgi:splicing factor 3B subunit 3
VSHLFNFSVDSPPTAMNSYFNKLLVGVGHKLMLYDIFKQKLVERATSDKLSSPILSIHVEEQKIFLTQVSQSFTLMKIDHKTKFFELIGQDSLERFTTCACLMDGEAGLMAGGDKFGNFFVSKLTESTFHLMQKSRVTLRISRTR